LTMTILCNSLIGATSTYMALSNIIELGSS
jgi:hypothetical protein